MRSEWYWWCVKHESVMATMNRCEAWKLTGVVTEDDFCPRIRVTVQPYEDLPQAMRVDEAGGGFNRNASIDEGRYVEYVEFEESS